MSGLGLSELLVLITILAMATIVLLWPAARICRRLGFSPLLGLLIVVPLLNVVLLWFVAFAPWPAFGASRADA
jgi:hypothetical protein